MAKQPSDECTSLDPPDSIRNLTLICSNASQVISTTLLKVELLQQHIWRVKEIALAEITAALDEIPVGRARQVVSDLYWSNEHISGLLRKAYTSKFRGGFNPDPKILTIACGHCQQDVQIEIQSWAGFKQAQQRPNVALCDNCRRARDKNKERWQLEHHQQREAEEKEIERLRSIPYKQYLRTEHWNRIRRGAYHRAGYRCQLCNRDGKLNAHHRTYERLGCERWADIIVLCEVCHQKHHSILPIPETEKGGSR